MKKASKKMNLRWIEQFDYEKQGKELAKKMDEDWRAR